MNTLFRTPESVVSTKRDRVILGMAILSIIFSTLSLWTVWQQKLPVFGMVDTQSLIHEQSKHLAKESPSGKIDLKKLQQTADALKSSLEGWAQAHHTILFAKGTIWGERLQDVTDQILTDLMGFDAKGSE